MVANKSPSAPHSWPTWSKKPWWYRIALPIGMRKYRIQYGGGDDPAKGPNHVGVGWRKPAQVLVFASSLERGCLVKSMNGGVLRHGIASGGD